jgi:site-specific DNA-methyltransferase (adenine-specific)
MTAPYYEDDAVRLYHGNCRDILPTLGQVDHVITDPPYEAEAHDSSRRILRSIRGVRIETYEAIDFEPMSSDVRAFVAAEVSRVARRWVQSRGLSAESAF